MATPLSWPGRAVDRKLCDPGFRSGVPLHRAECRQKSVIDVCPATQSGCEDVQELASDPRAAHVADAELGLAILSQVSTLDALILLQHCCAEGIRGG